MELTVLSDKPQETIRYGRILGSVLKPGSVIGLVGELGSGKTCFVQGIADALGIRKAVTSPTFTLINEYKVDRPLYHIDLYRLRGTEDAFGIGIEDYMDRPGITAIEWAERIADMLPEDTVHIYMEQADSEDKRIIKITVVP